MPASSLLSCRPALLLAVAAVVAGGGVGAYFLLRPKAEKPETHLPGPDSPAYQEYAEAFQVGVSALDAAEYSIAGKRFNEAIDKVPEEPAAWANRGLLNLRQNRKKEAAADLKRAHELAPDSPEVENLLGWLASKQGRYAEAADHFRKAIEHDPRDLLAQFALAKMIEKQGGADGDAQYQRQLGVILEVQPYNLRILEELVLVAARRKDKRTLNLALDRLRKVSPA